MCGSRILGTVECSKVPLAPYDGSIRHASMFSEFSLPCPAIPRRFTNRSGIRGTVGMPRFASGTTDSGSARRSRWGCCCVAQSDVVVAGASALSASNAPGGSLTTGVMGPLMAPRMLLCPELELGRL
jgi:hypothetical protein